MNNIFYLNFSTVSFPWTNSQALLFALCVCVCALLCLHMKSFNKPHLYAHSHRFNPHLQEPVRAGVCWRSLKTDWLTHVYYQHIPWQDPFQQCVCGSQVHWFPLKTCIFKGSSQIYSLILGKSFPEMATVVLSKRYLEEDTWHLLGTIFRVRFIHTWCSSECGRWMWAWVKIKWWGRNMSASAIERLINVLSNKWMNIHCSVRVKPQWSDLVFRNMWNILIL